MTLRRIQKELDDLAQNPRADFSVGPDPLKWTGYINGPQDTPYEGGKFHVNIEIPKDYPFKAPVIRLTTQIYHPSISESGTLCSCSRKRYWKPGTTIAEMLQAIHSMLKDPTQSCIIRPEVMNQFNEDRSSFNETAREWTTKYAIN